MSEPRLAKIIHQVAKMLVSLLEQEYGIGKRRPEPKTTE